MRPIGSIKHSKLSDCSTLQLICFTLTFGGLGVFTIPVAAQLPDFWLKSSRYGWRCFSTRAWWEGAVLLAVFGVTAFVCLKLSNRALDVVLDRKGWR